MKSHKRYRPYIRRLQDRDCTHSVATAIRIVANANAGGGYVIVQRGFPNRVIAVARTKRELILSVAGSRGTARGFLAWAKRIQLWACPLG